MDIVGPLPTSKSGNKYILVISDYFTKWAEAFGIPNQEAITVATKLVDHVFCRLSMPTQLHSDMGAQFESQLIKDISGLLGIKKTHTTPYHPQSDGLVERLNRTILSMLATTIKDHGEEWEDHLAKVCFAYNTSIHKSTGFTPFYLMYGRQARIPIDLIYSTPEPSDQSQGEYARNLRQSLEKAYSTARERLQTAAQRQKTNYDKCIHGEPFTVGDLVYLHNPVVPKGKCRKLHCPWTGPFSVIKRISDNVYHIQDTNNKRKRQVIHFDRLKPYHHSTRIPERNMVPRNNSRKCKNSIDSTRPPPPGANLQMIDDEDDDILLPSMGEQADDTQPTPPRRYPVRTRRRPARYSDD